MKKTNGITLVALIITVIVMLILVGVTVSVVINSNLIGTAQNAADATKQAYEEESTIGLEINGIIYQSVEDYLVGSPHNWQYTDETLAEIQCTCAECTKENIEGTLYTIGQTVNYTDNGRGSSTITGAKSGVTQGIEDNNLTANEYGENGLQTINKDTDTTWVVFGIEDTNKSGENETLLLTTANPTTEKITLYGVAAYKYGPEEIDRICKEIYGTNARGMKIEDVDRTLGFKPTGGMYMKEDRTWYTLTGFDIPLSSLDIWDEMQGYYGKYYTPDYPNGTTNASAFGNLKIDGYKYAVDVTSAALEGNGYPSAPDTTAAGVKRMVFGVDNSYKYRLSSRGISATYYCTHSGVGVVFSTIVDSAWGHFTSAGVSSKSSLPIRPIVSLTTGIVELGE